MIFPIIKTERLILREFRMNDISNIFETYSDDEVTQYYDLPTMKDESEAVEIVSLFRDRFVRGIGIRWAIELKESGEYIGDCGFNPWNKSDRKAEIGYALIPKFWSKGYALEAVKALVHYGFTELDIVELHRMVAMIESGNKKSAQLVKKIGFHYEGTLRDDVLKNGKFVSTEVYSLLRDEYHTD